MNITLSKNIFAKICALLFAVFLWFFVMNEQNPPVESTFTVPLEVSNNLEGYSVDYNIENVKINIFRTDDTTWQNLSKISLIKKILDKGV